jgi:hypothetical protein
LHRSLTGQIGSASQNKHAPPPRAARKNLLLSATIEWGGFSGPILIRNLSDDGAMIEGPNLPERGARVVLRRQELHGHASLAWRDGKRCGLRFSDPVSVEAWVAGVTIVPSRGPRLQDRVDVIQTLIRQGTDFYADEPIPSEGAPPPGVLVARLVDELRDVGRVLENVGGHLAEDVTVAGRHARHLQELELARQRLEQLIDVVAARNPISAARQITMDDLQTRLLRP